MTTISNDRTLPYPYIFLDWPHSNINIIINGCEKYNFPYLDNNNRSYFPSGLAKIEITNNCITLSYYNFPTENLYYQTNIRTVPEEIYSIVLEISNFNQNVNFILSFYKTTTGYIAEVPYVIQEHCRCVISTYYSLRERKKTVATLEAANSSNK